MSWGQQGQQNQQGWGQPNPTQPGQQNLGPGQEVIKETGWGQPPAQQNQQGWGQPAQQNQTGSQQQGWGQGQQVPTQQGWGKESPVQPSQQGWQTDVVPKTQEQGWGGQQVQQGQQNQQGYNQPFNPNPNQVYRIVLAINHNLSLDCSGQIYDKKQLIIYGYHNGNNQKWRFVPDGSGSFSIVSLEGGGVIEFQQTNTKNGGRLWVAPQPTNAPNQKWHIEQVQKGYSIKSAVNQHGLNVEGNNLQNSTYVILWPFDNANNSVWSIQPI